MLRARAAKLARAGLSAPKIRTLKAIAKAIDRGELDLPALVEMPADDAHRLLTAVHGIGPWTADIYLLSASAMPTPGRPATSRCRKRRGCCSS